MMSSTNTMNSAHGMNSTLEVNSVVVNRVCANEQSAVNSNFWWTVCSEQWFLMNNIFRMSKSPQSRWKLTINCN